MCRTLGRHWGDGTHQVSTFLRLAQPGHCAPVNVGVVLVLALVVAWGPGCGGSGQATTSSSTPPAGSAPVAAGQLTGEGTETADLGVLELGEEVRVAWTLTGTAQSRAIFSLRLDGLAGGPGATGTVGPLSLGGLPHIENDRGITVGTPLPGRYHVYLTQKVRSGWPQGFAATFQVFTTGQ